MSGLNTTLRIRLIPAIITLAAIIALYFILTEVTPYLVFNEATYGGYWSVRWWLAGHLAGGTLALLIGPWQMSTRFRNRYMRLHRNLGKVYIAAIIIASLCGFYMAGTIALEVNVAWSLSLIFLAFPWLVTVLMAYRSVRLKRIQQHREWMIRSYMVTFGFVAFRFLENNAWVESIMPEFGERGPTVAWFAWAVPLFITEIVLQWNKKG